jgi:ATP-dependent DNA helicase RecG
MHLDSPIELIPGIRSNVVKELHRLELKTISDLLFYFPFRHEDFSNLSKIVELKADTQVSVKGIIKSIKAVHGFGRSKLARAEAIISDETGSIQVVWFNQAYLAQSLKVGDEIFLSGTAKFYKKLQLVNPLHEKLNEEQTNIHTARIIPIYHLTANLPLRTLRTLIFKSLGALKELEEILPTVVVEEANLMSRATAIENIHFPETSEALSRAKERFAFEEIFNIQLALQKHKLEQKEQQAYKIPFQKELLVDFLSDVGFDLTNGQKLALWEILQDLEKAEPMRRLLQGDVGSGKTIVALAAALTVAQKGLQTVILAPTEILAQQHYSQALKYFEKFTNTSLILFTGKNTRLNDVSVKKKELIEEIAHGGAQIIIGTHATLHEDVLFKDLALVIIDEQHRFGVGQRSALKKKSKQKIPHLLTMTATPIPRTLRLTVFGDLAVSEIKQKPVGRKPILTKLVPEQNRTEVYEFITKQIALGHQVFVITPLIEESDRTGSKAAKSEAEKLKIVFSNQNIGLLHGKMKAAEKEETMLKFLANEIQILVSTSVVEVGVDIPNAAVILIEGADHFGLAQLHQFRGRVGRSTHQSYCFLFSETTNEQTLERLERFSKINDGFELAELDLENRGFGDLFGANQSGFRYFKYFRPKEHGKIAQLAKIWAQKTLQKDRSLKDLPHFKKLQEEQIIHFE